MDFTLSPDQELLVDTARRLLSDECPTALLRAHMDEPAAATPLWEHLREFTALGDGPLTDLVLFLEHTGYVAAPGPFFAVTALYRPLLRATGHDDTRTGTVAISGPDGSMAPHASPVKTFVPEVDRVDVVAIVKPDGAVVLAPAADVPARLVETVDRTRRLFDVDTTAATGEAARVGGDALADWTERAYVALAAELVGTARRMLDMSVAYAKERIQFDVPIGSFQAIQHKLAEMALAVERATSATLYAAMALDEGDADRHRAAHVAKAAAGEAAHRAGKDGIQVHGGIGYTWEHDLHLFIRRAEGSGHWMGTSAWHHDALADLLFA